MEAVGTANDGSVYVPDTLSHALRAKSEGLRVCSGTQYRVDPSMGTERVLLRGYCEVDIRQSVGVIAGLMAR